MVPVTGIYVCTRLFCLSFDCPLLVPLHVVFIGKPHRISVLLIRMFSSQTSTQRRTTSSSQVALALELAQQRSAVLCSAVLCPAVPCCAMLRALLYLLFRSSQVSFQVSYHCTGFVRTTLLNTRMSPAQLSPAIAQQRSAAPCGAVWCRALPCAVVLCRAALCLFSNMQYQV